MSSEVHKYIFCVTLAPQNTLKSLASFDLENSILNIFIYLNVYIVSIHFVEKKYISNVLIGRTLLFYLPPATSIGYTNVTKYGFLSGIQ